MKDKEAGKKHLDVDLDSYFAKRGKEKPAAAAAEEKPAEGEKPADA